ncbi:TonB-dependent receptor [Fulvivirga imtechensis AK7]|uniref:TonB-dependent receptor n=1 Tax=Fulvivirga imtechensis AK7 TaxID=1237149 RepID=L8JNZ8_9BACT|nr:TonB-dependent receptor [Fulvivirga imtechensis]ELR70565.1 TonB-dependent receptor [Fulvivirga imtechensis AK7]
MMKILLTMLTLLLSTGLYAQSKVTGKVTDETGEPLPGVNVLVRGTTQGTVTDINGSYSIEVSEDGILLFSFIGYVTEEIRPGSRTVVDLQLTPDVTALQEVIVVGYGTSTKKELTGAVSAVSSDDIQALNPQRIEQALQGQVAGVNITSASGSPGGALNIRIRGLSTNGDNAPLILVDGVPYSADGLNALNPSDIESVNVLKDATAGIYGVRAANGVIMITTKKGKLNSQPTFEVSGYYGMQEAANKLDLLTAREYAILKNEAYAAGGNTPPFNNVNLGEGTDWQGEVFERAPIQNYSMTVSGGSEKTSYSIGGSFLDQEGIVGGDKAAFRRYNGRLNFITELAPKVKLENVLLYTNENRSTLPENVISSVLYNAINAAPTASVMTNGRFTYLEEVNDIINPMAQMANSFNETAVNKLVGKQELTYDINNDFKVTGRAGYNYAIVDFKAFSPLVYYGSGKAQNTALNAALQPNTTKIAEGVEIPINNSVTESRTTYFNYNLEAFLNYSHTFGEVHGVKATLGASLFEDSGENLTGVGYNVPYNSNDFADISATDGTDLLNNTSSFQFQSRLQSYFIRAEYGFNERYLLSAILRRDASSRFGENNRAGYFPAVSAAWVASDESFFDFGFFQFAKVRASYGVSGNDRIGDFRYRGLLNGEGVYPFDDQLVTGVALGTLGNQDLKWETTHQANFGVDLTVLDGKIDISADYYIKTTKDLLFQPDVSGVVGAYGAGSSPPYINAGTVRNKGFEFLLSYNTKIARDVDFNVTYNLTTINNEVIELPQGVDFFEFGAFGVGGATATRMEVGYPIGYFFGYETDGVYQSSEEVSNRGVTQDGAQAGDLRYVDQNGDDVINFSNDTDRTIIGSPIPDYIMGLNLGLRFKGVDFSANIYSSIGNDILRNYERQQPLANLLAYRMDRWTGPGSTNEHPRLTTAANNNAVISDYYVEDGSFVRLKNVQLGYTLPQQLVEKIGATRFRIYVAANNLYTLTKYMGYDPDFSSGDPVASGIDYGFYPQPRTYMVGVNLTF